MRIEHGLVNTSIGTFGALERLGVEMIPGMIVQVMFVFGHEGAVWASEKFLSFDVRASVLPESILRDGYMTAIGMFAFVLLRFASATMGAATHAGDTQVSFFFIYAYN